MKRILKSARGVTLLEVMLVLAIAAMIIVMSIRYYQSATASQQANQTMEQLGAIIAAADGLSQVKGSYSAVTSALIAPLLPANGGLNLPWGKNIVIGTTTTSSINLTIPSTPAGVCPLLISKLGANNHFSSSGTAAAAITTTCASNTDISFFYIANP